MPTIPDRLRSLFTAKLENKNGQYTVEIPADEIAHDALQPGATYRIAILEGPDTTPDGEPATYDSADTPAPRDPQRPPVEEGEVRMVTIETVGDQGDGIAKVDRGYVVIVPETEPGAQPTVRIEEVRKNLAFASVVDE
jgi:predicted RNA-binding protein with TRAM domain